MRRGGGKEVSAYHRPSPAVRNCRRRLALGPAPPSLLSDNCWHARATSSTPPRQSLGSATRNNKTTNRRHHRRSRWLYRRQTDIFRRSIAFETMPNLQGWGQASRIINQPGSNRIWRRQQSSAGLAQSPRVQGPFVPMQSPRVGTNQQSRILLLDFSFIFKNQPLPLTSCQSQRVKTRCTRVCKKAGTGGDCIRMTRD